MFRVASAPGSPNRPNEDYVGILGNCAVLLDGSGAPGDLPTGCSHGVPWFVRQLASRCLAEMAACDPDDPLSAILAGAISDVAALHRDTCDLSVPGTPSSMVVMVRIGEELADYLVLGDSALIMDIAGDTSVVSDRRMEDVAPDEYREMLSLPTGTPEHQAARIAFVRKQQPLRNAPGGYPVASTDPGAAHKAISGSIPTGEVSRAALVSDGVTRFSEFGLGSWGDMLNILSVHGPDELFIRIRAAEEADPRGQQWPRAKQHDDVSVVFWEKPTPGILH